MKADLYSEDWLFGRGTADMKGGLAANLHTLFSYPGGEANILFTAVSDEENLSAGARQAVSLYAELKERLGLDYSLAIVSEPCKYDPDNGEPIPITGGSVGKILPLVVAKGRLAHSCYILAGLNSALIVSEIMRNVELSTAFLSSDLGVSNQPPATQIMRDLKTHYDVSTPEYSVAGFNMTFFMSTKPMNLVAKLKDVSAKALQTVVTRYNAVFDEMVAGGRIDEDSRVRFDPKVMTLEELKTLLAGSRPDYAEFEKRLGEKAMTGILAGETLQMAGIAYIEDMMEFSGIDGPFVVIGICPPYYPAVSNEYLDKDISPILKALAGVMREKYGVTTTRIAYGLGMTDASYTSCIDPNGAIGVMNNMGLPTEAYHTDFRAVAELDIPTLLIGPAGKGIHQWTERVYLPDVEKRVPAIFEALAELIIRD